MHQTIKQLWFQDTAASSLYINDVAVRIRAGILLIIPLYLGLTLFDVSYTTPWIIQPDSVVDTYETNQNNQIIYSLEATKRVYDYTFQTALLFYALFEMLAGLFVATARFSPLILISSVLAKRHPPVWKPLNPKRFAWSLGALLISICITFFNPEIVAGWVNMLFNQEILPETENFLPKNTGIIMVWICLSLMWLETILGICLGCKIHSFLVWTRIIADPCYECDNIDWDKQKRNKTNKHTKGNL